MVPRRCSAWVVAVVLLSGCGRSDPHPESRSAPRTPLRVSISEEERASVGLDTMELIRAPEILLEGRVRQDPAHVAVVVAPTAGLIVSVEPVLHAVPGTIVAVLDGNSTGQPRQNVYTRHDGTWHPSRNIGERVWPGDTIGRMDRHGFWLVVGQLDDSETPPVHSGDSATVTLQGTVGTIAGRVEWLRRRAAPIRAWDVAVEFETGKDVIEGSTLATAVIIPNHTRDSVFAVPATAVARLSRGYFIFVPDGRLTYQAHQVVPDQAIGGLVPVRGLARRPP